MERATHPRSINPINLSEPTDSDSSNHRHDVLVHKQEPLRVEKATDEQPDTERREDVDIDCRPFSKVDRATTDDYASLYSFM